MSAARAGRFRVLEGQALAALAAAHLARGEDTRARPLAEQALDLHRRTGHRLGAAVTQDIIDRIVAVAR